jgi:hypothetical protein
MRKIISVIMLALLLFVVTGCKGKQTYMADGTYMTWRLGTSETTLLKPDGTNYLDPAGKTVKVNTPALSTVEVTIHNDEVINYVIDELQSKAYIGVKRGTTDPQVDAAGYVTGVTWKFNDKTKRELEYGYGMEKNAKQGEWYIQIINLENNWLAKGPNNDPLASVTITYNNYTEMALEALQNAKEGKVGAITDTEHYTYDVTFVNANINKEGKISDVKLNAHLFGGTNENTYNHEHADYLKFGWNAKNKYDSYGDMSGGVKWQDQMDKVNAYINENGWNGSLLTGRTEGEAYEVNNGLNIGGTPVEALASVTIQLNREVFVMNSLYKFFPKGWN